MLFGDEQILRKFVILPVKCNFDPNWSSLKHRAQFIVDTD